MEILLYKLKDVENIREAIEICKQFDIKLHIIRRENSDIDYEEIKKKYNIKIYNDFNEFLEKNKNKKFIFFETYGDKLIYDVNLKDYDVFVFGAEDYGVPLYEIEKVEKKEIVKIPIKLPGSYNVVSSIAIVLTFYFS